jgi:hypothetical protein
MCIPIAAAVAIAGMAMQAYQANQQGKAAESQARHTADVARFNQKVGENNAFAATQAAEYEADLFDEEVRRNLARNRTLAAMSGVVINTGSVDLAQQDSLENAAAERLAILYNGQVRSYAARTGSLGQGFQAAGADARARAERAAGRINVGVSIAQSAYTIQQQGLLG